MKTEADSKHFLTLLDHDHDHVEFKIVMSGQFCTLAMFWLTATENKEPSENEMKKKWGQHCSLSVSIKKIGSWAAKKDAISEIVPVAPRFQID